MIRRPINKDGLGIDWGLNLWAMAETEGRITLPEGVVWASERSSDAVAVRIAAAKALRAEGNLRAASLAYSVKGDSMSVRAVAAKARAMDASRDPDREATLATELLRFALLLSWHTLLPTRTAFLGDGSPLVAFFRDDGFKGRIAVPLTEIVRPGKTRVWAVARAMAAAEDEAA